MSSRSTKKQVFIVSYTDNWKKRSVLYHEWFTARGFAVHYVSSNFNHFTLTPRSSDDLPPCGEFIPVPTYQGNLSLSRVLSYCVFSLRLLLKLISHKPDVVIATIPCNSTGLSARIYKLLYPKTTLILDIMDLWPESLPSGLLKTILTPFSLLWRAARNIAVSASDLIICECDKFSKKINESHPQVHVKTLYLMGHEFKPASPLNFQSTPTRIAYLGSINHIIDIDGMVRLLCALSARRQIFVEVIGCGVLQSQFLEQLTDRCIPYRFHGAVFNETDKNAILSTCHFGLNMMTDEVFVGLTTKSIDYSVCGLPILNSIGDDTWEFVERYGAGLNISDPEAAAELINSLTDESYQAMRSGSHLLFEDQFSKTILLKRLDALLTPVVNPSDSTHAVAS